MSDLGYARLLGLAFLALAPLAMLADNDPLLAGSVVASAVWFSTAMVLQRLERR